MELPPKLPPKKDVLIAFLAESSVFIHLDPRRDGVLVPKWFQKQPDLVLQIGLNMPIPIMDLEVGDTGVSCTLSFSRSPFWCHIPWHAIFALRAQKDHRGMVWPDDVPHDSELLRTASPPARPRPRLQAVSSDPEKAPPSKAASPRAAAGPKMSEEERIARGLEPEEAGDEASNAPPPSDGAGETRIRESLRAVPDPLPSEPSAAPEHSASAPAPAPIPIKPPAPMLSAARGGGNAAEVQPDEPEASDDAGAANGPASPSASPPASEPADGAKKGKRQLPPYLRVVK